MLYLTLPHYIGISPFITYVTGITGHQSTYTENIAFSLYHANWLIPLCFLCYISSIFWYQELADNIYRFLKQLPPDTPIKKTLSSQTFAIVVWLMTFLQLQLLINILPLFINYIISQLTSSFMIYVFGIISILIQIVGFIMNCCMYGWYGFDPYWYATHNRLL